VTDKYNTNPLKRQDKN